jgi:hypothetical protein
MATTRIRKFSTIDQLQVFLNGGVTSGNRCNQVGPPSNQGPGIWGLVGTTLTFAAPGPTGTVTFVASTGSNPNPQVLLFKDIKAQIEAAIPTLRVTMSDGFLVIQEVTPAEGVTVSSAGTANAILGFDTENNTVGKFYPFVAAAAPPAAPYWTWAYSTNDNVHVIYTYE